MMKGRGGFRQGAGRKPLWQNGETQTIRVPMALKDDLMSIGRELDQGRGVIMGKTCVQLENIVEQWEAKCEENQGEEWDNIRQLILEIKEVLAQRQNRGRMGNRHQHQQGQCHKKQMRRGNPNWVDAETDIVD